MPHANHAGFESFLASAVLILVAVIYLRGWLRLRKLDLESVEGWRAGSFLLGLLLILLAVASPLAALDHELLTVHMAKHFVLMTLVPPLILLGAPVKLLLRGLPQPLTKAIGPLFRSAALQHLGGALTHPAVCWLAAAGALVVWHIPAVFILGMRSHSWYAVQQASFLATGLLFWWPVIRPWPSSSKWPEWSMVLYLFLATLPCDILSGFLVFCDRVIYPIYFSSSQPFGMSALEDQQCAGALMWTGVTVVYLIAGGIFTARLLSPHRPQGLALPHSRGQSVGAV